MVTGPVGSLIACVTAVFLSTLVHEGAKEGVAYLAHPESTTTTTRITLLALADEASAPGPVPPTSTPAPCPVCPPAPVCDEEVLGHNSTEIECASSHSLGLVLAWVGSVASSVLIGRFTVKRQVIVRQAPTTRRAPGSQSRS